MCSLYLSKGCSLYINTLRQLFVGGGVFGFITPLRSLFSFCHMNCTGAGSAQGAANRRRPLHPRALAAKSPLRGALSLSLTAFGSGAR